MRGRSWSGTWSLPISDSSDSSYLAVILAIWDIQFLACSLDKAVNVSARLVRQIWIASLLPVSLDIGEIRLVLLVLLK